MIIESITPTDAFDVHMFAAKLPKSVSAYTFANDLITPNVFVVLVQERLNFNERRRLGWDEVYAHVAQYPRRKRDESQAVGIPVYPALIRHFSVGTSSIVSGKAES